METLKPCPFCESESDYLGETGYVWCTNAACPLHLREEFSAEAWNSRPNEVRQEAIVEALRTRLTLAEEAAAQACAWFGPLADGEACPLCGGDLKTGEGHVNDCPYPALVKWDQWQAKKSRGE